MCIQTSIKDKLNNKREFKLIQLMFALMELPGWFNSQRVEKYKGELFNF